MWKIARAVDLSLFLDASTPVYPGEPAPRITPAATVSVDGYNTHTLQLGSHGGTHVDAPYHMDPAGSTVEKMDLILFAGEGVVVTVRGKRAGEGISRDDLDPYLDRFTPGAVALFNTGWDKKAGSPQYGSHPHLGEEACRILLQRGVRAFGIDTASIDPFAGGLFPVHRLVARAGGVIAENLANLDQIDFPRPLVLFFPLKLTGCDGSPVRAAALQLLDVGC